MTENQSGNDPLEWVRVTDADTGHSRSIRRIEVPHANYEVLDEPAIYEDLADSRYGEPLPPVFNPTAPSVDEPVVDYDALGKKDLEAEIARRNESRAEDDLVVVDGKGNKPDLVKALAADDEVQAAAAAANLDPAGTPEGDGTSVDPTHGHQANDMKEQD